MPYRKIKGCCERDNRRDLFRRLSKQDMKLQVSYTDGPKDMEEAKRKCWKKENCVFLNERFPPLMSKERIGMERERA